MLVSNSWCDEVAKDIIYEFEVLLCEHDIKIENKDLENNEFETENSYINKKDYEELTEKVVKQLKDFADYVEYELKEVA